MNREDTKKAIEVMQAYVDGHEIQVCLNCDSCSPKWFDNAPPSPEWNWLGCGYRIKPKPREFWLDGIEEAHRDFFTEQEYEDLVGDEPLGLIKVREVL